MAHLLIPKTAHQQNSLHLHHIKTSYLQPITDTLSTKRMNTPKQIINANNKADEGGRGVTPLHTNKAIDNTILNNAVEIMLISNKAIYQYIKPVVGIRSRNCYHLMLICLVYPANPITYFIKRLNSSQNALQKNMDYLVSLGYVMTDKRARLIIPFNRYTYDTVYSITTKGRTVINKLIGLL